jgi:mycothiol synthase
VRMPQLRMEKCDLNAVPAYELPAGYTLRNYRRGDEDGLCQVYASCNLGATTPQGVRASILDDPRFSSGRMFILEKEGVVIGSALAWREMDDPDHGYLHMLGILPEHRGQRLGYPLTLASIKRTQREGYSTQRLFTDDDRLGALKLYIRLGYRPLITDESHAARWVDVGKALGMPIPGPVSEPSNA